MGEEVPATSDELTPLTSPETAEVRPEDSPAAFARNTAVMALGTTLSRVTGFLRVAAMAYAIGITETRLADAYNIANTTPNIVYELALGGILSSVLVPVLVERAHRGGRTAAFEAARRLFTLTALVLSAIAALVALGAPWIVGLYTIRAGADQETTRELATFFLRWFAPQIVFYGLGAVGQALLNAERRFAAPMFAPILNNLLVIGTFLTFAALPGPTPGSGELATPIQRLVLGIGTTAGVVGMTLALWPSVRATGFRFGWRPGLRDEVVATIARLGGWVVVYVAANQVGYLLVLILAAARKGDYAAYGVAFILFQLPHAIFTVSIVTALLPAMSSRASLGDLAGLRALLARGVRATAAILIPAAFGYLAIGRDIVRLLFEHGATTARSGDLVAEVLALFSIGLFPFSLFQLQLRTFYALQDTRTPALINIGSLLVNAGVNLLLVLGLGLGVRGLAIGHASSYVFASVVALLVLRRRLGGLDGAGLSASVLRSTGAAVLTAAAAFGTARGLGALVGTASLGAQALQVFGAVLVGLGVYLAAALIFRIEEVDTLKRQVLGRWRR
ncbi:putative peptidoglycan biosynthesis protein MviN [bacterium HR12]|nr:putative peptidoglycan biosynthesis protein MviN [bacterium HR12]